MYGVAGDHLLIAFELFVAHAEIIPSAQAPVRAGNRFAVHGFNNAILACCAVIKPELRNLDRNILHDKLAVFKALAHAFFVRLIDKSVLSKPAVAAYIIDRIACAVSAEIFAVNAEKAV